MSRYLTWRRRRALGRALRWLLAVPVRHPRAVAGPGIALGVLGAGAALRAVAPPWQVLVFAVLLAAVPAIHTVRAALPPWRRAARWVAVAAGVATAAAGWWWAAFVLGLAVAVAVVEVPRLNRVTTSGDELLPLPTWARPGRLAAPARLGLRRRTRTHQRSRADVAAVTRTLPRVSASRDGQRDGPHRPVRAANGVGRDGPGTVRPSGGTVPADEATVRRMLAAAEGAGVPPVTLYRALGIGRSTFHRRATEWIAQGWLVRAEGGYRLAEQPGEHGDQPRTQPPGAEFRTLPS